MSARNPDHAVRSGKAEASSLGMSSHAAYKWSWVHNLGRGGVAYSIIALFIFRDLVAVSEQCPATSHPLVHGGAGGGTVSRQTPGSQERGFPGCPHLVVEIQ